MNAINNAQNEEILKKIKTKMSLQNSLILIKSSDRYLQYKPIEESDNIWKDKACHYEFRIDKNRLQICFHCEHEFSHQEELKKILLNKKNVWFPNLRIWFQYNKSWIIFKENIKFDADTATKAMIEFENKYGKNILKLINESQKEVYMTNDLHSCINILKSKKNIILQGAPGTGKTYNTAALALSICNGEDSVSNSHKDVMNSYDELIKKGRIGFVSFHQSMDYEDFIEGIKPKTNSGQISYEIEDGIFKEICDLALTNYEDSQKTTKERKSETDTKIVFENFCSKLEKELSEKDEIILKPGSKLKITEINRKTDGSAKSISISKAANSSSYQNLTLDIIQRDYQNYKNGKIKKAEDIKPKYESKFSSHGNAIYYFELFRKMKEYENENRIPIQTQKVNSQNYVLIIDEINRGNVSKIFGELISLLEADKRVGGDHPLTVTLPYSKEPFSVPSNLYIIGTMNTTDRSVGSIDYAVRRRFAFYTLKANKDALESYYNNKDSALEQKAINLFKTVENFIKDNQCSGIDFNDLMVGHSYFMAQDYDELKAKWKYEVIPLLEEYKKDGLLKHSADLNKIKDFEKLSKI